MAACTVWSNRFGFELRPAISGDDPSQKQHKCLDKNSSVVVQLYREMRRQKINKTGLAQRMNVHLPQIDRLFDLEHGSKIEQLEAAARALGGQLDVVLVMPQSTSGHGVEVYTEVKTAAHRPRRSARREAPLPRVHGGILNRATRKTVRRSSAAKKK